MPRTILGHLNITVADDDPRTAEEIAADLESAMHVGVEGSDLPEFRYCWTLVEEI
jgi:hypothetical protein